jgi:hypothetical protein
MRETLDEFIKCLHEERFADAHEVMEHQWMRYKKQEHPLTKLLKGYINGATAFELIKRGRKIESAQKLWSAYEKYLPALQEGIEEYDLFVEADELLGSLRHERLNPISI